VIPISDDNPVRGVPYVTVCLIGLCVLVYLWELTLDGKADGALMMLGLTPDILVHSGYVPGLGLPAWATLISSMFLHASILHIAGNMLYLWIFGNNIEEAMGNVKFALFYLICGTAAGMTMVLMDPGSRTPIVGASGAISGVLGAYILLFPRARVHVIVPVGIIFYPFRIRAVWVVGFWFAIQLVTAALMPPSDPGVAWWAHVGGFAAGLMLTPLLKARHVPYFGPVETHGPWG
jgi:membrane associated rhomboid family serine protease